MEPQAEIEQTEQGIPPEAFVAYVTQADNLAAELSEGQLNEISQQVISEFDMDKESMSDWFERMKRGLDLAKLVKETKNYPFEGAANVKYPLITSAALQFNARSYPAIVANDRVVMARVWGRDQGGIKAARADRISEFMSWQLSGQIPEWEEETDKLLVQLPIVGTMARKWWYDPVMGRPRCRVVDPGRFIVNNKVKTLDDAPRCSEELPLYPAEIKSRILSGQFVDFEYDKDGEDEQAAQDFIEQHTRLDLDEDGYPEPYVVTVHKDTQTVVRLVADFSETDVSYVREQQPVMTQVPVQDQMTGVMVVMDQITTQEVVTGIQGINRGSYFVAHHFLPSMDGGFHGTGLGLLLGDISDTINSIINMMMDAGHYASLGGGFIGAEFRMKGGGQRHKPGEWKMVASTGAEIKNSIVPITFPGPDQTLFQMLGMLIDAGREIASVKDVVTGEQPRQQQTATTTLALIEQGMMVFTAAYKRIFRAMKHEYTMLAGINRDTLDAETYNRFHDEVDEQGQPVNFDPREDFSDADMNIQPVADPRSVTKMQQAAKAQLVMQLAETGMVDRNEALARVAEAMDIEDVEALTPKPDPMQEQMAQAQMQMQMQFAQADLVLKQVEIQMKMAEIEETRASTMKMLSEVQNDTDRVAIEAQVARLNAMQDILEDERKRMEAILRGPGGMAHKSGNGNSAQGNGQRGGTAESAAVAGLLGGATAGPGIGGGSTTGGAMGGGFL